MLICKQEDVIVWLFLPHFIRDSHLYSGPGAHHYTALCLYHQVHYYM